MFFYSKIIPVWSLGEISDPTLKSWSEHVSVCRCFN